MSKLKSNLQYLNCNSFYLGPFLECVFENWVEKTKSRPINVCEKCARQMYEPIYGTKFCQFCGGKIIESTENYEIMAPEIEIDDLCQKYNVNQLLFGEYVLDSDNLDYIKAHYVMVGEKGTFSIDRYSTQAIFTPEQIQKEIETAIEKYKDLILEMESRFQKKNVNLYWGLIPCENDW